MLKKISFIFSFFIIVLLFNFVISTVLADGNPTNSPEALPSATPTINSRNEVEISDKAFFDVSNLTLEHEIDPECVDQFPMTPDELGSATMCVTFNNWIIGDIDNPTMLDGGYEMIAGIEGWYEQDGQQIAVVIPVATANRDNNELQINGGLIRSYRDSFYGDEGFFESMVRLVPGDTVNISIALPTNELAGNSTQGFGFEAAAYTQEDIDQFFATGDASGFDNILWPVGDIAKRW